MEQINIFPWDENFCVGIDMIDQQHQKLVDIINTLATQLTYSRAEIDLDSIFGNLIEYTQYHFDSEEVIWEKYLKEDGSDDQHKKTHAQFIDKISGLIKDLEGKSALEVAESTLGFLVKWLVTHILEDDRHMSYIVLALKEDESLDKAKESATIKMSGDARYMIDIIIKVYESLANNTLKLMNELDQNKIAKEQLNLSEERLALALNNVTDGLWDWNLETNEVYYSPRWFQLLGYEDQALPSDLETWKKLVNPKDQQSTLETITDYVEGRIDKFEVELQMKHIDGHWVDILARATLATDDDGNLLTPKRLIGTHVDITERLTQQKKIELEQKRYVSLLDTMVDGFWLIDTTGVLLEVNLAYAEMSGYTQAELLGKHITFIEAEHDEAKVKATIEEIKQTGHSVFESMHKRKNGEIWDVEVSVSFSELEEGRQFVVIRDISERKAFEKQLHESNQKLELRVQGRTKELTVLMSRQTQYLETIQSILVALDENGNITLFNPEGLKLLGYEASELIGKNWFDTCLPQPEGHDMVLPYFKQIINGEAENVEYHENHILKKDGEMVLVAWHNAILRDSDGKQIGVLSSGMNITKQKMIEQELIKAKEKAEEATNIKSSFLANMSHEIRTPMNSVIGMTDLALDSGLEDSQKNYVQKANTAAKNLLGIINDILDISKMEAGKLELTNTHFQLTDIIKQTIELLSVATKNKHIKIKIKKAKDIPKFYFADSLRLGQVLTNLATNAVKFSHKNGTVTLKIDLLEDNKKDALLRFSIEDEGIGISKENQRKLFEPFTQADNSTQREFGGTGLGLAISYRMIQLMHGEIWIDSEKGKGCTVGFTVRMNKSTEDAIITSTQDTKKAMQLSIEKLQNKHILLVEDNELNQELAVELLTRNGLTIKIACNGKKALEILETESFDGILMDCQMPIMDGYEATRKIRKQDKYKALPILAMTANVMKEDIEKAHDSGMNDHIAKPIDPINLFITLAKWVSRDNN